MMIPTTPPPADLDPRRLAAGLRLGPATLAIAERERSLAFYRDLLGLTVIDERVWHGEPAIDLGVDSQAVLRLVVRPGIGRLPRDVTGLYHAAILLPDRDALGRVILRLRETGYPFGASDHGVSEALYFDDPDGNGLEIYRDRSRSGWTWKDGRIQMTVLPLDLDDIVAGLRDGEPRGPSMPAGTTLGHMHLRVGDASEAERFYARVLGFDVVASVPGARFFSVGGYHHHLGTNQWESAGSGPRPETAAGLLEWEMLLPTTTDLTATGARLSAAGVAIDSTEDGTFAILDPWGTRLVLRAA